MSEFRRTEAEIHNFKKIIDQEESIGSLNHLKDKRLFEKMLKRQGFPNLNYFRSLDNI